MKISSEMVFASVIAMASLLCGLFVIALQCGPEHEIDPETQSCVCGHPDHEINYSLELGVPVGSSVMTIPSVEPRNFIIPPELGWISYSTVGNLVRVFCMSGTPDTVGTYTMAFDVLGSGHYHLNFTIWE